MQKDSLPQPSAADHQLLGPAIMSHSEIGRALGISRNASFYADQRAKRKIRAFLIARLGADFFGVDA